MVGLQFLLILFLALYLSFLHYLIRLLIQGFSFIDLYG